ncbi:hypothetical protein V9T40_006833 [Parthenolecanium corni]|uniref:Gag protein n=1 Tax=Parthenolecanium corni TaxID=536013 RepID=A0AAN9TPG9_9HEMI
MVDDAVAELNATMDRAKMYRQKGATHHEILFYHAAAVGEDLARLSVLKLASDDKITVKELGDAMRNARTLKRELETDGLELRIEAESKVLKSVKVEPEPKKSTVKVPPIKLPVFSGDVSTFHTFYKTFVQTILENDDVPEMAKWVHLRSSLQGVAAELVCEIPEAPNTIGIALKLLSETFGDVNLAITELYSKLHTLPPAVMTTASLRMTYGKIEGILLALANHGRDLDKDDYARSIVIGKFPSEVAFVCARGDAPLKAIRVEINEFIRSREKTAQTAITTGNRGPGGFVSDTLAATSVNWRSGAFVPNPAFQAGRAERATVDRPRRCVYCSAEHYSDECKLYYTVADRQRKLGDRCRKCLRNEHPGAECTVVRRCSYCDDLSHHRSLCLHKFPEGSWSSSCSPTAVPLSGVS